MCMRWKNRHFAAIVRRQQERKKNLAFFSFTRGKRGAFSSPLSLSLSVVLRTVPPPLGTRPPPGARVESSKCHRLFPKQA